MDKTYQVIANSKNPIIVTVIVHNYVKFDDIFLFSGYSFSQNENGNDMEFVFSLESTNDRLNYEYALEILAENGYEELSK